MSAGGQGPRDKSSRLIKPKSESDAADASYTAPTPLLLTNIHTPAASSTPPVTASSTAPAPASSISPTHDALPAPANDASKCSLDVKTASKSVPTPSIYIRTYIVATRFLCFSYFLFSFTNYLLLISRYDNMIYDALKNLNDPNGSDATAIVSFIEVWNSVLPLSFYISYTIRFYLFSVLCI